MGIVLQLIVCALSVDGRDGSASDSERRANDVCTTSMG